ncbi:THAP-type domain-containing protein, partial [Biomphalaria glabrata]
SSISAEELHNITKKIIVGLDKIGLNVMCVVADNNAINRKTMSLFMSPSKLSIVYPHPVDKSRPLLLTLYIFLNV